MLKRQQKKEFEGKRKERPQWDQCWSTCPVTVGQILSNAKLFQVAIFAINCTALQEVPAVLHDQLIKTTDCFPCLQVQCSMGVQMTCPTLWVTRRGLKLQWLFKCLCSAFSSRQKPSTHSECVLHVYFRMCTSHHQCTRCSWSLSSATSHQDQMHSPGRQGGQQEVQEDFWH